MARLFLTNIDLNQNELQNAVIQNLSTAPSSGNTEGRIYYDSTRKTLRVYRNDSIQGAKWYDLSVGGASASTVTLTGDVTGTANVDPTTGIITVNTHFNVSGTDNQIVVNDIDNTTTISLAPDTYIKNNDGYPSIMLSATGEYIALNHAQDDTRMLTINTDGSSASITATGNLNLTSNNGDVNLNADSNVVNINGNTGELHLQKDRVLSQW